MVSHLKTVSRFVRRGPDRGWSKQERSKQGRGQSREESKQGQDRGLDSGGVQAGRIQTGEGSKQGRGPSRGSEGVQTRERSRDGMDPG